MRTLIPRSRPGTRSRMRMRTGGRRHHKRLRLHRRFQIHRRLRSPHATRRQTNTPRPTHRGAQAPFHPRRRRRRRPMHTHPTTVVIPSWGGGNPPLPRTQTLMLPTRQQREPHTAMITRMLIMIPQPVHILVPPCTLPNAARKRTQPPLGLALDLAQVGFADVGEIGIGEREDGGW
jgi:hypothetical protein